jgi:hypothetical protein
MRLILNSRALIALLPIGMLLMSSHLASAADRVAWEYRVIRIDDSRPKEAGGRTTARSGGAQEALNKLGEEGWELVAVRIDSSANRTSPIFYLKRPKVKLRKVPGAAATESEKK